MSSSGFYIFIQKQLKEPGVYDNFIIIYSKNIGFTEEPRF
uniref:Uncharacterized protein n=1 Tax=viral metagenome TaxID=1070528 RepID=A0A6C0CV84_9ZZZZ